MEVNPPSEEYRYLHVSAQMELSFLDKCKLVIGMKPLVGACFRIVLIKDEEGRTTDVDVDFYSTRVLVAEAGKAVPTSDAIFNYDKLHKTDTKGESK